MNQFPTIKNTVPNTSKKLLKLKFLLESSNFFQKNQSLLLNTEKSFNVSPDLSKNLPLYLSLIEKPVNLLFSLDQFLFEFSKYQQRKTGEFFQQLKERKKLSLFYGYLSQKQLQNLFIQATKKKGYFSKNIFSLLEQRLDVVIYRSGLVNSIAEARQLIRHKKIRVNNQKITIPSYCLNPGDIISLTANTIEKRTHEIIDGGKSKRKFLKIYGDLFAKLKTTVPNLKKKTLNIQSKIACNLLIQLISTRIQLRSFLNFKNGNSLNKFNCVTTILALLKWKKSSTLVTPSKNVIFGKKKQKSQQGIFDSSEGSLQKNPVFWSTKLINLKSRNKRLNVQREFKFYKSLKYSQTSNQKNQTLCKNSFLMFLKHLNSSKKFTRLIRLNMRKCFIKRPNYLQKSKILDFRIVKPINLEISYNLLTIIYLYSPQRINFPFYIDLDLIKRSFR